MKNALALIVVFVLMFTSCAGMAAQSAPDQASKSWVSVLQGIDEDIDHMHHLLGSLDRAIPKDINDMDRSILKANGHLNQVVILAGVTGNNPWALRTVLSQVESLRDYLVYKKHTLMQIHNSFGQIKDTWGMLQQVRDENGTQAMTSGVKAMFEDTYARYRDLKREITIRKEMVDKALAKADKEVARIDERYASLKTQVVDSVEEYSFHIYPSVFTIWGMTVFKSNMAEWASQVSKFWMPLLDWVDFVPCVNISVLSAFILFWAGFLFTGWRMRKKDPEAKPYKFIVPLILLAFGLGFTIGPHVTFFSMNHAIQMLCRFFIFTGASMFVWTVVKLDQEPDQTGPKTPLFVFLSVSVTGYFLQFLNMPPSCAGPVWAVVMAGGTLVLVYNRKSYIGPLARVFSHGAIILYPVMAVASILGMGAQMVLLAEAWMLMVLAVYIAVAARPERVVKAKIPGEPKEVKPPSVTYPLVLLVVVYGALGYFFNYLGGRELSKWAINYSLNLGSAQVSIKAILLIICAFFVLKLVIHWIQAIIGRVCREYAQALSNTLQVCVSYIGWLLYAAMILGVFGVPLNSLAWIASGLSVGIGFGMKDIVNNFVSGLILLFGGSVKKGDIIQHKTTVGVVTNVSIRNTTVLTLENNRIIIPNSSILKGDIINYSLEDPRMRLMIPITLAPGAKEKKFKKIVLKTVKNHPHILKEPEPEILFKGFGQLGLEYTLNCWIDNFQRKFKVENELFETLNKQFMKKKVQVAFRTVKTKYKLKKTPEDLLMEMKEKKALFYDTLRKRKRMASSGDRVRKVRASWARGDK